MADTEKSRSYAAIMFVSLVALVAVFLAIRSAYFAPKTETTPVPETNGQSGGADQVTTETPPKPPVIVSRKPATGVSNTLPGFPPKDSLEIKHSQAKFVTDVKGEFPANDNYSAIFCDRGAVLSVMYFQDRNGNPIYFPTPHNPMDTPDSDQAMQLIGPQGEGTDEVALDPSNQDHFADDMIWTFGFSGSEAWRNRVRWDLIEGPVERDGVWYLSFRSPPDSRGGVIEKYFEMYPEYKIVCRIRFINNGTEGARPQMNIYGPVQIRQDLKGHQEAGLVALYETGGGILFDDEFERFEGFDSEQQDFNAARKEAGMPGIPVIPAHEVFGTDEEQQIILSGICNGYFIAAIGVDYIPSLGGVCGSDVEIGPAYRYARDPLGGMYNANELSLATTYNFPVTKVEAGEVLERRVVLFAGPRDQQTVEAAFIAGNPRADSGASWSEFVTPGWPEIISIPITWLLKWLATGIGSVGLAIMCLTLIVRFCMAPISIRAQRSMLIHGDKMRKIKPKLDEVKEKYKDNPSREAKMLQYQELRAVMKTAGVSMIPLGGCLPLLLQFPIFIALYYSIRSAFLLRHESFLWIRDLARPDAVFGAIEADYHVISANGFITFNILPILWAAMMFIQSKTSTSQATDPQQQQMQKMMLFMGPLFGLFFYAMPAGFVLYFVMSLTYSFVESRSVKYFLVKRGLIDPKSGTVGPMAPM